MAKASTERPTYLELCQRSPIGKRLPDALYVDVSALTHLDPVLQAVERKARSSTALANKATLVKFSLTKSQLAYLFYPDFDPEAHPVLKTSMAISLRDLHVRYRDYDPDTRPCCTKKTRPSPPIIPTMPSSPSSANRRKSGGCWTM